MQQRPAPQKLPLVGLEYEEGSEGGSSCWNSVSDPSELIRAVCVKFYGRVGQRSGDPEDIDGAEKYDSCITGGDSNWKCRVSDDNFLLI